MTPVPAWLLVILTLVAAGLACAAPVRERIYRAAQRLRRLTPLRRAIATAIVFFIAAGYLSFTALWQGRPLYPKYHDSQSYAIQAQIIASGRLWLPPHPMADFFDTFHVIVEPVYCSMYFPGTAMVFAVGLLAGLPFWPVAAVISAGCVALLFRVIAEIVDGWSALLAAVWLMSLMWFRYVSVIVLSQPLMLLLGLAMFWAYLHWRRKRGIGWALLIGTFAGFAAITRPADALAYAVPLGFAILFDCFRKPFRDFLTVAGAIVTGAAPWLILQVIFNLGVTGDPFHSPYRVYLDRDAPQLSFGYHDIDPTLRPTSPLVQKHVYHQEYNVPLIEVHRPGRLVQNWSAWPTGRFAQIADATVPAWPLLPLVAVGLLGLTTRARVALWAVLPTFCLFYVFYPALLQHYTPVVAPAIILSAVLGMRVLKWLAIRWRPSIVTFFTLLTLGLCASALPELNRRVTDDPFPYPEITDIVEKIPAIVQRPALVLVRYPVGEEGDGKVGRNVHAEPVYNWQAARIDDNPIIKAHELGPRTRELLQYYLAEQPNRHVYLYDRAAGMPPRYLGLVAEALKEWGEISPTTRSVR